MLVYRKVVAIVTLTTTLGCYTALPLQSFPPPVGNDVVAMLTDGGTSELASVVGPRVTGLTGRFVGLVGDTLLLSVKTAIMHDGNEVFWRGEQVGIPRSVVASMSTRQFSAVKSSLIVGGVVAALAGITGLVYAGHAGSSTKRPPPTQ